MDGHKPDVERDVGVLEDGAFGDSVLLAAPSALPHTMTDGRLGAGTGRELVGGVHDAAMGADWAFRPSLLLKELAGGFVCRELGCDGFEVHGAILAVRLKGTV